MSASLEQIWTGMTGEEAVHSDEKEETYHCSCSLMGLAHASLPGVNNCLQQQLS